MFLSSSKITFSLTATARETRAGLYPETIKTAHSARHTCGTNSPSFLAATIRESYPGNIIASESDTCHDATIATVFSCMVIINENVFSPYIGRTGRNVASVDGQGVILPRSRKNTSWQTVASWQVFDLAGFILPRLFFCPRGGGPCAGWITSPVPGAK